MNIMLCITGLGMGGAETQVTNLADELISQGHNVLLVSLTGLVLVKPQKKVEIISLGMNKTPIGLWQAYIQIRKLVKRFKPDVIHSHMVHANILLRLLRITTFIPRLVCTAHSVNEGGSLRMYAYQLTDCLADISTNVSVEAVDAFIAKKAVPEGRMIAVHNGINVNNFKYDDNARNRIRTELGLSDDKIFILAVGRLTEAKDYPNLLLSFSLLLKDHLNLELMIVGAGDLFDDLKKNCIQLGIQSNVRFLGIRNDIADVMSASDLFVLSSAWEGFGLVVAEAMACERIVIATNSGGVAEVLGGHGYLVPPADSELLENSIRAALRLTADQKKQLGRAARMHISEKYSLSMAVSRWIKIYQGQYEND